ncbi:glycosyl hydrolase family 61-domain-containing protein [Clohesyomyces aquaticus]|uniref:lytic cellulose monooxygenase (C4-dehydrogenating) n=1 Tax=Clohesyomyces aquaticus TaxID=1231657 RepID=A0A1Y1ZLS4_9PLEO|nr:glycosyl hydrolase family 61-domain-containing protein [Clohesyomyces aquaticus]
MKTLLYILSVLAVNAPVAFCHWNYDRLIVNGQIIGDPYQYVRRSNDSNTPLQNVNSTDLRCNSGGESGASTLMYTVQAGDKVGFGVAATFGHPGPQQVYTSNAPAAAADYDGSGGWARIYSLTTSYNASAGQGDGILKWATYRMQTFQFTLPASTPPGEYLLRAEGLALHAAHKANGAQFYVRCAQIRVTGNGDGSPGPLIEFPREYHWISPGVLILAFWSRLSNYTAPGPSL